MNVNENQFVYEHFFASVAAKWQGSLYQQKKIKPV